MYDFHSIKYSQRDVLVMDGNKEPCGIPSYRKVSNIRHTLVGNKIVDDSDVVGASPVGAAPTTSLFWT